MRTFQLRNVSSRFATNFAFAMTSMLQTVPLSAQASELIIANVAAKPTSLSAVGGPEFLLTVHPEVGKLSQPRTVFVYQPFEPCPGTTFSLDTSLMESQNLVLIRKRPRFNLCPAAPTPVPPANIQFEFTPSKTGQLTVRVDPNGPEFMIRTVTTPVQSNFDVNGMWFDPATNGSGIAMQHYRMVSDAAFGTWFLYSNNGESRWYTFQSANWQQDGNVLEGLLYGMTGQCSAANLVTCPAQGSVQRTPNGNFPAAPLPSRARITFQSQTRAHAEVSSLGGTVLFTSELTKLQF